MLGRTISYPEFSGSLVSGLTKEPEDSEIETLDVQSVQIVEKLKYSSARTVRAENKRHRNSQAYIKHYYCIFRSGLSDSS